MKNDTASMTQVTRPEQFLLTQSQLEQAIARGVRLDHNKQYNAFISDNLVHVFVKRKKPKGNQTAYYIEVYKYIPETEPLQKKKLEFPKKTK